MFTDSNVIGVIVDAADTDCDGYADTFTIDTNYDGYADAVGYDTNEDGLIDVLAQVF